MTLEKIDKMGPGPVIEAKNVMYIIGLMGHDQFLDQSLCPREEASYGITLHLCGGLLEKKISSSERWKRVNCHSGTYCGLGSLPLNLCLLELTSQSRIFHVCIFHYFCKQMLSLIFCFLVFCKICTQWHLNFVYSHFLVFFWPANCL